MLFSFKKNTFFPMPRLSVRLCLLTRRHDDDDEGNVQGKVCGTGAVASGIKIGATRKEMKQTDRHPLISLHVTLSALL